MLGERTNETIDHQRFCVPKTATLEHKEHNASVVSDGKLFLSRSADVLVKAAIRSNLELLFRISVRGRGFLLKASGFMK